jgi:hypothetical protein
MLFAKAEVLVHQEDAILFGENSVAWSYPNESFLDVAFLALLLDTIDFEVEDILEDMRFGKDSRGSIVDSLRERILNTFSRAYQNETTQSERFVCWGNQKSGDVLLFTRNYDMYFCFVLLLSHCCLRNLLA